MDARAWNGAGWTAINADASRTDARTASATGALGASRALASLGSSFGPTICDQLIDQAAIWCHIGKKPVHPLGRRSAAFDLRLGKLDRVSHAGMVLPASASLVAEIFDEPLGCAEWDEKS
jgi:hypothetical protein